MSPSVSIQVIKQYVSTFTRATLTCVALAAMPIYARAQGGASRTAAAPALAAPAATTQANEPTFSLMIWESVDQIRARTDATRSAAYWQAFADFGVVLQQAGVLRGGSALRTGEAVRAVAVRSGRSALVSRAVGAHREELGGYFVIAAASLEDAMRWAERVPAALTGVVEVRPAYPAPTMMSGK